MTRQRRWQKEQVAKGCCSLCGQKRPKSLKLLCRRCQDKQNALHLRLYHAKKVA